MPNLGWNELLIIAIPLLIVMIAMTIVIAIALVVARSVMSRRSDEYRSPPWTEVRVDDDQGRRSTATRREHAS